MTPPNYEPEPSEATSSPQMPWPASAEFAVRRLDAFHNAGCSVEIQLGAERVVLGGERAAQFTDAGRHVERDLCEYARWLIARDRIAAADLVRGIAYKTTTGVRFTLRLASLEEAASASIARLCSLRGTALRRVEADAIASVMQALAQRAAQPIRRTAA